MAPPLKIAIPNSALGWGHHGVDPSAAAPAPATIGFGAPEEPLVAEPAASLEVAEPAAPIEVAEPATSLEVAEPAAPVEVAEPAAPVEVAELALPSATMSEAPAAAVELAAEPTAALAEAPPRDVAAGIPTTAPEVAAETAPPLPSSAGETSPAATQLRAPRPLGAPQASPRRDLAPGAAAGTAADAAAAAGLSAGDLPPALIEPEIRPAAPSDQTAPARLADAAGERTTMRNRRLYRRVAIDAEFEINGTPVQLLDISMGGFAATRAPSLASGATVSATLRLAIDGVDVSARMRARMIYCDDPHANTVRSGGRFIELTASQTALLRYIVTWQGQSTGTLGTTTLLDAITRWPEQGLPAAPSLPPPEADRRPSWWSRALGWFRGRSQPDHQPDQ